MLRNKTLQIACASVLVAMAPWAVADVTLKGQVNRAVMYADDGVDSDTFFVDNDASSTRIIIDAKHPLNADVTVGAQFEVEHQSNASNNVSIGQTGDATSINAFAERKLELYFDSKTLGRLWLGQGDTASDGSSEVDLSGTSVVSYSETGSAGGNLRWRNADGSELDGLRIYDVTDNFDGLSRDDRIRYDTPSLAGFMLSASASTAEKYDVALRYNNDFGFMKLAGAIAYADMGTLSETRGYDSQFNGSISALFDFGLSLTFAGGTTDFDSFSDLTDVLDDVVNDITDEEAVANRDEPISYWGKLGYQFSALPVGKTAVSIEYGMTEDYAAQGDEYMTYGASLVQKIDKASTELFLHYQGFELDRDFGSDPEDIFIVMGGARVKF